MNGYPVVLIGGKKGSGKSTAAGVLQKNGAVVVSFAAPMKRFLTRLGVPHDNVWGDVALKEAFIDWPEVFRVELQDALFSERTTKAIDAIVAEAFPENESAARRAIADWFVAQWRYLRGLEPSAPASVAKLFQVRHALQTLGTECGRSIDPDAWGKAGLRTAFKILSGGYVYGQATGLLPALNRAVAPPKMVAIDDCRFPNELLLGKEKGAFGLMLHRDAGGGAVATAAHASETSLDIIPSHWWDAHITNDGSVAQLEALVYEVVAGTFRTNSYYASNTRP